MAEANEADDPATKVMALEFGAVIARGTPAEVLAHDRVIASYLGGPRQNPVHA